MSINLTGNERPMDAATTLLHAFKELHQRGYEGLKVYASLYGTGHWRCSLGVVGQARTTSASIFNYSSSAGWRFFNATSQNQDDINPDLQNAPPEKIADMMIEKYPTLLENAKFACPAYAVWYEVLLGYIDGNGYFYMAESYWGNAKRNGYIRIRSQQHPDRTKFPLSPVF